MVGSKSVSVLGASLAFVCLVSNVMAGATYTITNLGSLDGVPSPEAINDLGQVVGFDTSGSSNQAFLWQPSVANSATGALVSLNAPNLGGGTFATGINASGEIVGYSTDASGNASTFLWQPATQNASSGTSAVLPVTPLNGSAGQFKDPSDASINASGEVATDAGYYSHPALWVPNTPNGNNGTVTELGKDSTGVEFYGEAGLNASGEFTGNLSTQTMGRFTPNVPDGTTGSYTAITSPGQGGSAYSSGESSGVAINAAGDIAGYGFATLPGNQQALLWLDASGAVIDLNSPLGATDAAAQGINDSDQVVGESDGYAFLYSSGSAYNLNTLIGAGSNWILTDATGINNEGQIIGVGTYNGVASDFLLTTVPEPTSVGLIGLGVCGLLVRSRRATAA